MPSIPIKRPGLTITIFRRLRGITSRFSRYVNIITDFWFLSIWHTTQYMITYKSISSIYYGCVQKKVHESFVDLPWTPTDKAMKLKEYVFCCIVPSFLFGVGTFLITKNLQGSLCIYIGALLALTGLVGLLHEKQWKPRTTTVQILVSRTTCSQRWSCCTKGKMENVQATKALQKLP